MSKTMNNGEIILYQLDSSILLEVRMEEAVWAHAGVDGDAVRLFAR